MTRDEYLTKLRTLITEMPAEERDDVMTYYSEYFDDAGPENEQDVIRQLGSPEAVACEVMGGVFRSKQENARQAAPQEPAGAVPPPRAKKGLGALWGVILAICAAPVALPLAIAGVAVVAALAVAVVAVVGSLILAAAAVVVTGIASVVLSFTMTGLGGATVLFFLGSGIFCAALGILCGVFLCKLAAWCFNAIATSVSNLLNRRRVQQ